MNINATLLGELVFILMIFVGALSYYLGRRKTQNPVLATLLGVVLCLIPPFALLYLIVLVLKHDITPSAAVANDAGIP